jgi:para-aminobenzoate synthetase component 1
MKNLKKIWWTGKTQKSKPQIFNKIKIRQRISETAISKSVKMLSHIQQGDLYEANFCMEFYAENAIDPLEKFQN